MQLSNHLGLPEPIVRAVAHDDYERGDADITVTELISPPRQIALLREHGDALIEDASDRIFALLGQSIHEILRRAELSARVEERLSMPIAGWTVSGQFDRMVLTPTRMLQDYKVTSVWSVIDGVKEEHAQQLNCYAHLARHHGVQIEALEIVAILRDWSKMKARREPDYPQTQVVRLPLQLWSPDLTQVFMEQRVQLHRAARERLPECSAEERWLRGEKWAVMKRGRIKAIKLHDTQEAARQHADGPGLYVEHRPGEHVRCAHYCAARGKCSQARGLNDSEPFGEET